MFYLSKLKHFFAFSFFLRHPFFVQMKEPPLILKRRHAFQQNDNFHNGLNCDTQQEW
jgi:hypothetical protein